MEYLRTISIPAHNVVLCGRPVGDMVERGMRVREDGTVKGKFHHMTRYIGYSSTPEEQEGYYLPLILNTPGEKLDIVKNGVTIRDGIEFDPYIVLRVTAEDTFEIKVDGKTIASLNFSQAVFQEKKGENDMNVNFFDPGACGLLVTGYIGTMDKDSETEVTFEKALPVGARMVYLIAIPSDDMEGAGTVSAGDGATENLYADGHVIEKGKGGAAHPALPLIANDQIKVKLDSKITKGTVKLYATVIRLEV